jgi:hypothetical protein
MADQLDIDNLVRQLQDLVPALSNLTKTPTTGGSDTGKGTDRIVMAIAKLSAKLDQNTNSKVKENLEIAKFTKEIEDAAKASEKLQEQQKAAADAQAKQDEANLKAQEAQNEALRRSTLSAQELAKEDRERAKSEKIANAANELEKRRKKEYAQKEIKTAGDLINEYGRGVTGTAALREKFEGLGGTSMGTAVTLKLVTAGLDSFVKAMSQYVGAIYEGEQGAMVAAKSVTTFADTLGGAMQVLGGILILIPGFQLAGAGLLAVGTAGKLAAKANEKVAEMSDRLYGSYQELSKVGVTASDGMTGVAASAQKLGYGLDKIGQSQFIKLMSEASKDLSMFAGSAVEGRKRFGELSGDLVRSDLGRQFMNLGMSVDDINSGVAGFLKQQVSLGRAQVMSDKQVQAGATDYLKTMDALTKLTGIQKKELESQLDANRRNERFRAAIEKVRQEQGDTAAQNLEYNMAVMSERFPNLSKGLMDVAAGFIDTEEAAKVTRAGLQNIPQLMTRGLGEGFKEMGQQTKRVTETFGALGRFGGYGGAFGDLNESIKASSMGFDDAAARARQLIIEQDKQARGASDGTAAATDLRRAQLNTKDSLQDFVKAGVQPSTTAMKSFSSAIDVVTNKILGRPNPSATTSGPPTTGNTQPTANTGAGPAPTATTGGGAAVGNANLTRQADQARQASLADKIIQAESGGRNIGNIGGTTTAFGLAQFTQPTFEGMAKQAGPTNPLYGKTFEDYKADVGLQREALRQLMDQNRQSLAKKGLPTTDPAIYLAHFLGATGASRVLSMPDDAPITAAVSAEAMAKNPGVFKNIATIGDLKGWASQKMGGVGYAAMGGIVPARRGGTPIIAGEAGLNEAFVPLPNGKSIPVTVNFAEVISKSTSGFGPLADIIEQIQTSIGAKTDVTALSQAFRSVLADVMQQTGQRGGDANPAMIQLLADLVSLQRDNNSTTKRLLQVSAN